MAVASALVFAGQMINYTIPGTGSSGHMCGGMLLSALLGPQAGFLSMAVVLTIQCLFFADGGLMALGANIWNRLFENLGAEAAQRARIIAASIIGCIVTLQMGAFSVVLETTLSGITELPFSAFCGLMLPIHLAIGLVEGLITAAVLTYVYAVRPELLRDVEVSEEVRSGSSKSLRTVIITLAVAVVVVGGIFSHFASSNPDGLEWALFGNEEAGYSANMGLDEENFGTSSAVSETAAGIQEKTSFLPDYAFAGSDNPMGTTVSGIVGSAMVAGAALLICYTGRFFRKRN